MRTCGRVDRMGHGDNAICGQPYINGIYQCQSCYILELKEQKVKLYTDDYYAVQSRFHMDRPDYGISGSRYADQVLQMAKRLGTRDLLDYGCGKCTLQKALPFPIKNYDPFIPEHATRPEPADFVVCTDVMEHVEPMFVDDVLYDIASLTKQAGFFQIATRPASKVLPDGRNAHLIQEPMNWWLARLMTHFEIKSAMVMDGGFVAVVAPLQKAE